MASLKLNHIYKVYPNGVKAVDDFNMQIEDKEFIVFVGPSGCGKSTTLRMIAGLEEISAGELRIGDEIVNDKEPKDRDIAMVFQNYALYPHMTVFDNIAFSLKLAKIPREERDESKITIRDKNGKKFNFINILFARTPLEERDENGHIVLGVDGKPKYVTKKNKDGTDKVDKNGHVVYKMRPYTIDEYAGPVILGEDGRPKLIAKTNSDGTVKLNKNGKVVYKLRKYTKPEIKEKVEEAARILGITDYLKRRPKEMSGGQRQRVALGRAIVRNPKVMLLDEPLSNLDAKLRTAMRSEITKLQQKLQTTFIYVTHDQIEAMTMGSRIVVMKAGVIQQIDTPRNLYRYPYNKFVAGFIGTPQMNFYSGKIKKEGDKVHIIFDNTPIDIVAPMKYFTKVGKKYLNGDVPVIFGIRAEHISSDSKEYPYTAKCRVNHVEELGIDCQIYGDFGHEGENVIGESPTRVILKAPTGCEHSVGDIIDVSLDITHLHIFDSETEQALIARIPVETVVTSNIKGRELNIWGSTLALPAAISIDDGEYEVVVPTSAVSLGGKIKAKFVEEGNVNDKRLIELEASGSPIFLIDDENKLKFTAGQEVLIDIDFEKLTFMQGDKVIVEALNEENILPCKLVLNRAVVEDEANPNIKKVKSSYTFEIADYSYVCPETVSSKLIAAGGKKICNTELAAHFTPNQASLTEKGVSAKVERILDYGKNKYAECSVGSQKIHILSAGNEQGNITINIDVDKIAIYEPELDVRLV